MSWSKVTVICDSGRATTAAGRRVGGDDHRGGGRVEHVDLVRLADQDAAVGRGDEHVAAGAAVGDRDAAQRGQVDHRQLAAGVGVGAGVLRDEQQARRASVPGWPKAIESMSASNVSITSARAGR